jgi:hypothetical protein
MSRTRLPDRRPNVTLTVDWQGHALTVTVGFDPATGAVREVFGNAPRGQMHAALANSCVAASLALQHGASLAALARPMLREPVPGDEAADAPACAFSAVIFALLREFGGGQT